MVAAAAMLDGRKVTFKARSMYRFRVCLRYVCGVTMPKSRIFMCYLRFTPRSMHNIICSAQTQAQKWQKQTTGRSFPPSLLSINCNVETRET